MVQKKILVLHLQQTIGALKFSYSLYQHVTLFSLNEDTDPSDNSHTVYFTVTAEADVFIQS